MRTLQRNDIHAQFREFPLPPIAESHSSAIIPTVRGIPCFKYGIHAYYFLNFQALQGVCVTIRHKDITLPSFGRFLKAAQRMHTRFRTCKSLLQRYHYRFNLLEQIRLMTVPHTITHMKNGRFLVNLWSYFDYIDVDCRNRSARRVCIRDDDHDHVLGAQQFYDGETDELYGMSYSLEDSLKRIADPERPVSCRITKRKDATGDTEELWSGGLADYLHDIVVNRTRRYCVVCEMGMYTDDRNDIIPSKVLVLDLHNGAAWTLSRFIVAAHAQFDPDQPDVVYFSNHNFRLRHANIINLLRSPAYGIRFHGPASVYKYRLTANGPVEMGMFTHPDLFRLTNSHPFNHRGRTLLVLIGYPNFLFLVDADSMTFLDKMELDPASPIGTIAPSPDGEKVYVQTTRSFQIVDIATKQVDTVLEHRYNHSCANHMIALNGANG